MSQIQTGSTENLEIEMKIANVDLSSLDQNLSFMIRLAQLESFKVFFDFFSKTELLPGEFSSMLVIFNNPKIRQGVLASSLKIKRANMAKIVRGMEVKQMITKSVPDDDRRSFELSLTEKGKTYIEKYENDFATYDKEYSDSLFTEEERKLFLSFLYKASGYQAHIG